MTAARGRRSGGQILVDQLIAQGVDTAFGVPGESYLEVLDALFDSPVRYVTCRQEGGAAMMAEAWGKLTGRPGICMVTRAPGATNASAGVHVARQDSTPMILLIGDVAREQVGREAFQEVDFETMFAPLAKWATRIDSAQRIPEIMGRAFNVACSGRPGPVVIALPEDMLRETAAVADLPPAPIAGAAPDPLALAELRDRLLGAQRPFALIGGGGWSPAACADFTRFAETFQLPVGVSFRCQDYFDNDHPCYAGHVGIGVAPSLAQRIRESDLLLVVGARLGEMTTSGYTLIEPPKPRQALVHVYPDASELGRVYRPDLGIVASIPLAARALAALAGPDGEPPWGADTAAQHRGFEAFNAPLALPGRLQYAELVNWLSARLPPEAMICNGAGNYAIWVHRFYRWRRYRSQLAPTSGSMGYGVPAAIAAAICHPQRPVVCFAGDGCFLMHGQELATAVANRLNIVFIVVDNGQYGTIRMHQERRFPSRASGTALCNPDFVEFARAFGAHGERVESTEAFAPAFERAVRAGGPALIELPLDAEILTPSLRLSTIGN